jgi:hypothetical protein
MSKMIKNGQNLSKNRFPTPPWEKKVIKLDHRRLPGTFFGTFRKIDIFGQILVIFLTFLVIFEEPRPYY